jgi:prepilin-type N-terminal cleavage/methylation domain-containing protein
MRTAGPRGGFTLIELLAVMTILAILATVGVVAVTKFQRRGEEQEVQALIQQIVGVVEGHYETAKGDFPPDDYAGLASRPPNDLNPGIESLVAHLAAPNAPWDPLDEKHLRNVDEDRFPKKSASYTALDAFEYADRWGNPLAYFHCKSYGRKQKVLSKRRDTGVLEEQEVEAARNAATGDPDTPATFQILSAGPDGVFGTSDDLGNFARSR